MSVAGIAMVTLAQLLVSAGAAEVRVIAHRGGIVDRQHIENNLPAIEEAVRRGYWMLEVDIRESKDGHLVVHHDDNFRRFYDDPRRVADMTWNEIAQLRSAKDNLRPLEFSEYAAACSGKIYLMLDTKGDHDREAFFASMIETMRKHDLLDTAFVIGNEQSREVFRDKAKVGVNFERLRAAVARGEVVAERYFLFAHADAIDGKVVDYCESQGVTVVPSINTFHYPPDKHKQRAKADIERLKQLGVRHFQIDSVYEDYCTAR